jgi:hypothetical protein
MPVRKQAGEEVASTGIQHLFLPDNVIDKKKSTPMIFKAINRRAFLSLYRKALRLIVR